MKKILVILLTLQLLGCTSAQNENENVKEEKYKIIKGLNSAENGDLKGALESFKKAYEINPNNILTVRSIGLAYLKLGDQKKGAEYLNEALKINEEDEKTLYNLAILNYENNDYEEARKYLEKIKIEKTTSEILKAKAYVYYNLNDYQKSYLEFNKFFNEDIFVKAETYAVFIDVLKKLRYNEKIYEIVHIMYKNDSENLNKIILLTNYLNEIEAYEESIRILKKYGIEHEFNETILYNLAICFYKKGDYIRSENYIMLISDEKRMKVKNMELLMEIYIIKGDQKNLNKIKNILRKLKGLDLYDIKK